jgi:hypothetical protein
LVGVAGGHAITVIDDHDVAISTHGPGIADDTALRRVDGAPVGAPMSIPACNRPQRCPKPLVTGPWAGHAQPPAEARTSSRSCLNHGS